MRRRTCWGMILVLMAGGMGLWAEAARAQEHRGWYLNTGVGINQLDLVGNEDLGFDLGVRVVGGVGFRFNRRWALELDSGFIRTTSPRASGPDQGLNQVPLVVTGVFHFPNASKFEPFVGAGLGGTVFFIPEDSGMDATFGFKGGVRRGINDRAAIGIDYTYFMWGIASLILGEPAGNDTVNLTIQYQL